MQKPAAQTQPDVREIFDAISRDFQAGQLSAANKRLEAALIDYPDNVNFLHLGGLIKQNIGEFALAEKMLRTAWALRPQQADIMHNLAVFLLAKGGAQEAVGLFENLTTLAPKQAHIWANLGHACRQSGQLNKALEAFSKARALDAMLADIDGIIAMTQKQLALWDAPTLPQEKINANLAPIFLDDPAQQLRAAQRGAALVRSSARYEAKPEAGGGRLRIGYLSSDLHDHATSHLIAELFAQHDRAAFEVFVYSYGGDDQSAIRARLKQGAEHWVECANKSPAFIAERIFRDRIHILVDLKGYTRGGLPEVLAARPAPIIIQWLGFPATMGADFIDYIVADHYIIPPDLAPHYAEKINRLPYTYQINDRKRPLQPAKNRAAYGLPDDKIILCCFNQPYKITPPVFDVWCNILKTIPQTALWLFATHADAEANLRAQAAKHGITHERIIFAQRAPQADHIARYGAADLVLDTAPYGGHTTISDALWAGVPVVALNGKTFASRVSGSLLHAAGLGQLITTSLAAYEQKIRALIIDVSQRDALRNYLHNNRETLALFDTPSFVRGLEQAYRAAWHKHAGGEKPSDIEVAP